MLSNNSLVGLWIVSGISGIGINSYSLATTGLKTNDFSVSTLDSTPSSNKGLETSKVTEQSEIVSKKEEVEIPVIQVTTSSPQQPTETLKESIKENSKDIKSKEEMPTQKPEEVKDEVPQKKDSGKDEKETKSKKKKNEKSKKSPKKNKEQNSVSEKETSNSKDIDISSPKSSQSSSKNNHEIIKDSVSSTTRKFVGIFASLFKKIIQ